MYTVTGQKASADEVDRMIETGESESIFQKAILEQGRGHVSFAIFVKLYCILHGIIRFIHPSAITLILHIVIIGRAFAPQSDLL